MGKQDDFFRTQIRIPADLHRALKDATEDSGRSLNAEIVARLTESFQSGDTLNRYAQMSLGLQAKLEVIRSEMRLMHTAKKEAEEYLREIRSLRAAPSDEH